jgi:hypothetical protein
LRSGTIMLPTSCLDKTLQASIRVRELFGKVSG